MRAMTVVFFQPVAEQLWQMVRNMSSALVNGLLILKIATSDASRGLPG